MTFIWEFIARMYGYSASNVPEGYAFLYAGVSGVCTRLTAQTLDFYQGLDYCVATAVTTVMRLFGAA